MFLADMNDFAKMNEVYKTLGTGAMSSRVERECCTTEVVIDMLIWTHSCVAVKTLPLGTDVEIECVAVL